MYGAHIRYCDQITLPAARTAVDIRRALNSFVRQYSDKIILFRNLCYYLFTFTIDYIYIIYRHLK